MTLRRAIPRPVSSVYSKQSRRDSFYLTNDPGIANHSRKKQFIPAKWTHSMSLRFKAQPTAAARCRCSALNYRRSRGAGAVASNVSPAMSRIVSRARARAHLDDRDSLAREFIARTFKSRPPNPIATNRDTRDARWDRGLSLKFDAMLALTLTKIISRRGTPREKISAK